MLDSLLALKEPAAPPSDALFLASLLSAVEDKEARRIAARAADHLLFHRLETSDSPAYRETCIHGLAALLRHVEEGEARRLAAFAVTDLLERLAHQQRPGR